MLKMGELGMPRVRLREMADDNNAWEGVPWIVEM